jgi:sigma-B regulation protein RsbU (phosphoserine phosphatase)
LVYTDGVTEALDADGQEFGEQRLQELLPGLSALPPKAMVDKTVEAVQAFAQGVPQADDITCLALRYLGDVPATVE